MKRKAPTLPPCPFAAEVEVTIDHYHGVRRRACAANRIELYPAGSVCCRCPSRATPPADARAQLRTIRDNPYVNDEQRAVIDRVLQKSK